MPAVLIVDDHPLLARALAGFARLERCEARVVHSGDEALAAICSDPPDLVILDMMLPGLSGLDVLRAMHKDGERYSGPPVAAYSANDHYRQEALSLGAVAFVLKDRIDELQAVIRRHCTKGGVAVD